MKRTAHGKGGIGIQSVRKLEAADVMRNSVQKDIWLVGGGDLIQQFINNNLIDEFRIFVHPIILGKGIPLFTQQAQRKSLTFMGSQSFPSGLVELRYRLRNRSNEDSGHNL